MEIKNAKITSVSLGYADHCILTCYLRLEYGGGGQSFGGYALDTYDKILGERVGHRVCGDFIINILNVVGVRNWEELEGQCIRVRADYNKVHAIGNILKDEWFAPAEDLKCL